MKVVFIYLKCFSWVGGIEKFNRAFMKALECISNDYNISFEALSLYDDKPDTKYIENDYFHGYKGNKISFVLNSFLKIFKHDTVIIGHINLYLVGIIAILFRKKVIVVAHGIEVWDSDSFLKKYMLKNADNVLSVSRYTKSRIIENISIDPERITIFPNTIDPYFVLSDGSNTTEIKAKYGIPEDSKVILTVCRLSSQEKYKGYEQVLKVLPELKNTIKSFRYLIVGGGDKNEKDRISSIIQELDLQENVILAGEITDENLAEIYSASDVFIMPSTGEGFGIVFLEALASGLPVIAGNKDGSADPLKDGELGILVNPEDQGEILASLSDKLAKNIKNDLSDSSRLKNEVNKYFGFNEYIKNLKTVLKLNI